MRQQQGFWILLSLALAFGGLIALRYQAVGLGILLCLLAGLTFILSLRMIESSPSDEPPGQFVNLRTLLVPLALWSAGLYLTLFVLRNIILTPATAQDGQLVAAAWVASVALHVCGTLVAAHWRPPNWVGIREWARKNRAEILLVAGLTLAAFVLRVAGLSAHPYPWSGDEAAVGREGVRILRGIGTTFFGTGWSGQPIWSFLPTGISVALFGNSIFATRIVSATIGALTIPALYMLGRILFNQEVAFLSAAVLVAYPYHLQFSRLGVNNVNDGFNAAIALFLCFYSIKRGGIAAYTITGVVLGLSIYTYLGSRLVVALAGFVFLFVILTQKGFLSSHLYRLAALGASALTTALPMALFFYRNPQVFMTRINQEGIFQSGWLQRYIATSGEPVWQVLLNQFAKSTLVYVAQSSSGSFFRTTQPFLTLAGSVFLLLGMVYAFANFRKVEYLIVLLWFWSVVILGSVLTQNPPATTRMVMAIPATALLVGLGLDKVFRALQGARLLPPRLARISCAALVGIIALQGALFYFGQFRSAHLFEDANSEVATEVAKQLHGLGPGYTLYLLGAPRVFATFPTIPYINPDNTLLDLNDTLAASLEAVDPRHGMLFVAIPEQKSNLVALAGQFPGGKWAAVQRITKPEVLYYAYIVKPPAP